MDEAAGKPAAADAPPPRRAPLLTVGHGTLPSDSFASLLGGAAIDVLVDVRAFPGSRRNPQYGAEAMASWLREAGIAYQWEPRLGGRRRAQPDSRHRSLRHQAFRAYADHMETDAFAAGLQAVVAVAARRRCVVMCSESVWWRCHRRLLADATVLLHGVDVEHMFHDGRRQRHPVTPEARVEGAHLVYDDGQAVLL